jgi:hypothetical protein
MSLISKITQKISGVASSRVAPEDSEVRTFFKEVSFFEPNPIISERYLICSDCPVLKEEFRLFGVIIKDMEPTCGECGCNLNLKIPLESMSCPLGKW